MTLVTLGVGAQASSRYAPAGVLTQFGERASVPRPGSGERAARGHACREGVRVDTTGRYGSAQRSPQRSRRRDRILERDPDDLGRIDDPGVDQIDIFLAGRKETE